MEYPKADVALLTSVPEEHLLSGLERCQKDGFVAYGTNAAMVLSELKQLVDADHRADILFYASHSAHPSAPIATHRAQFVDYDGAVSGGVKPAWRRYRPASTGSDTGWGGFYLVSDLRCLETPILIANLKKRENKGKFKKSFVPLGPILIDTPF